jgi:hypothetical protein
MGSIFYFIHLLGAISMGYYLLLPFMAGKLAALAGDTRKGFASSVRAFNTFAQIVLLVQLLTGGYLMSLGDYSVAWMVATVVLILLIGAFSGMLGKPLKRVLQSGADAGADVKRIRLFSALTAVSFLLIIIIMFDPSLLG